MSRVDISVYAGIENPSPTHARTALENTTLAISEIIVDTIQGENLIGNPAVFLRLAGCKVGCEFCDTTHIWKHGISMRLDSLLHVFHTEGILQRIARGARLIITGGSPLLQQDALELFLDHLRVKFTYQITVEIENEATIAPSPRLRSMINVWNNSPKLSNSLVSWEKRYVPEALKGFRRPTDYFKFVVSRESDWEEIRRNYIDTGLVLYSQIVLMPLGKTRAEIAAVQEDVVKMAIRHGVRYSPRLHVDIWDGADGV